MWGTLSKRLSRAVQRAAKTLMYKLVGGLNRPYQDITGPKKNVEKFHINQNMSLFCKALHTKSSSESEFLEAANMIS